MLKSMTGFGRSEVSNDNYKITVEMKSVNHRYMDANIKLPRNLIFFETPIRTILKEYIERGKVDVFISCENLNQSNVVVKYNSEVARQYIDVFENISRDFSIDNDVRASVISRFPEVIVMEEEQQDSDEIWEIVEKALREACENFVRTRIVEGEHIKADLLEKLDVMSSNVEFIKGRSPQIIAEFKEKITGRIAELLGDIHIDETRIATEVTIFADKVCVDEELVRLSAHIATMKSDLINGGAIGRKLDFLAQEMNREANTTLSKSSDLEISDKAIAIKTDIEKIREQIQNIE